MNTLERQLADFGEFQTELHPPISPVELTVRREALDRLNPHGRGIPRWALAPAAALVIGALVGGVAWLTRDVTEDQVVDQTTITTFSMPETTETTENQVVDQTTITTTALPETAATTLPMNEGPLIVTDVIDIGLPILPRVFGTDRFLAAGGAIWVGIDSWDRTGVGPSPLFRIDPATREVTDELTLPGPVIDLVADSGGLWALLGDDTVARIDMTTREVIVTVDLSLGFDRKDPLRSDMMVAGGGLWIAGGEMPGVDSSGGVIARVDLETFALDLIFRPLGGTSDLPATMWVGEHAGVIWGLDSHNKTLVGFDLATFDATREKVQRRDGESFGVLGDGAIWVAGASDGLTRFDLNARSYFTVPQQGGMVIVMADGGLWEGSDGRALRYDKETGELTDTVDGFTGGVRSMISTADGSLWLSTERGALVRIDTTTRELAEVINVGTTGDLLAYDGAIWIAAADGMITRVGSAATEQDAGASGREPQDVPGPPSVIADAFVDRRGRVDGLRG